MICTPDQIMGSVSRLIPEFSAYSFVLSVSQRCWWTREGFGCTCELGEPVRLAFARSVGDVTFSCRASPTSLSRLPPNPFQSRSPQAQSNGTHSAYPFLLPLADFSDRSNIIFITCRLCPPPSRSKSPNPRSIVVDNVGDG